MKHQGGNETNVGNAEKKPPKNILMCFVFYLIAINQILARMRLSLAIQ